MSPPFPTDETLSFGAARNPQREIRMVADLAFTDRDGYF